MVSTVLHSPESSPVCCHSWADSNTLKYLDVLQHDCTGNWALETGQRLA